MSDKPEDYLNLHDFNKRRRSKYESAPITKASMREVLDDMRKLLLAKPSTLLIDALDQCSENVWPNEDHCLCRWDLRRAVGQKLARAASVLNENGGEATPLQTVEHALQPAAVQEAA